MADDQDRKIAARIQGAPKADSPHVVGVKRPKAKADRPADAPDIKQPDRIPRPTPAPGAKEPAKPEPTVRAPPKATPTRPAKTQAAAPKTEPAPTRPANAQGAGPGQQDPAPRRKDEAMARALGGKPRRAAAKAAPAKPAPAAEAPPERPDQKPRPKFLAPLGHEEALAQHLAGVADTGKLDPQRPVTAFSPLPAGKEEVEMRPIVPDRAFVRSVFDTAQSRYIYEVIEPTLDENEAKVSAFIRDTLVRTLDGRRGDEDWPRYLRHALEEVVLDHDILIDRVGLERVAYHILRDFIGFGRIDVMMQDPMLEDVSCDGPGIPLYIFHREFGSVRTNMVFDSEEEIDAFVIRLAQRSGKHISIADPLLDATLPDGSRLQATLSREVTSRGSSFTIRKFRADPMTPPDLISLGTMDPAMAAYFWFLMDEGRSLLYAGGTASGKTTSLNAVCQFIPPEKKIVSIEDTREINLLHENWIAGVTRSGFGGSKSDARAGTVDMYKLLEAALRQRPEYLIVGEVRGPEALTLFQAMATGHAVYSTMHADSVKSAVYRLENPPINVPRMMLQTLDTVAIQTQVRLADHSARRISEVVEIIGFDPDTEDLLTNTVFHWDHRGDAHRFTGHSEVLEHIQDKRGWTDPELEEEWRRRIQILEYMRQNGIRDFKAVSALLHEYYRRPEKLLARIRDRLPTVHTPLADHTPVAPEALHPETDEVRPIDMDEETDEELDDLFQQPNAEDTWR